MIIGRFGDTSGRPYVEGRIYIPRLGLSGDLSFLMDTGADSSILMPGDAKRIGVPFDKLVGDNVCFGLGGETHCFQEPAFVAFGEHKLALYLYSLTLDIYPPNDPQMDDCPSLLGRDVLKRWQIDCDFVHKRLRFTVHSADLTFPVKPPEQLTIADQNT